MACSSAAGQMPNTSTVALTHRRSLPGRFYLFVVELVMGLSFCESVSVCLSLPQTEGLLFASAVGIDTINKLN